MSERHRHDWRKVEGAEGIKAWGCAECDETSATCQTCDKASGSTLLLCEQCKAHADVTLDRIERAVELVQPPLSRPDGTSFRREAVQAEPEVVDALLGWAARWSEYQPQGGHWTTYLKGHHLWAAHNVEQSDWPAYWKTIHHLLWKARGQAGLLPRIEPEPCIYCGGDVVRDWSDDEFEPLKEGLSDRVRCTQCGTDWPTPAHWRLATRDRIVNAATNNADRYVTLEQAHMLWPDVPISTMRSWARRDELRYATGVERAQDWWAEQPEVGPVTEPPAIMRLLPAKDGRYRIADLAAFGEARLDPDREGRPARQSA